MDRFKLKNCSYEHIPGLSKEESFHFHTLNNCLNNNYPDNSLDIETLLNIIIINIPDEDIPDIINMTYNQLMKECIIPIIDDSYNYTKEIFYFDIELLLCGIIVKSNVEYLSQNMKNKFMNSINVDSIDQYIYNQDRITNNLIKKGYKVQEECNFFSLHDIIYNKK